MVNVPVAKPSALRLVAVKPSDKRSRKKDIHLSPCGSGPEDAGKGSDDMKGNPVVVTANFPPAGTSTVQFADGHGPVKVGPSFTFKVSS
jgi:hypothetical protein